MFWVSVIPVRQFRKILTFLRVIVPDSQNNKEKTIVIGNESRERSDRIIPADDSFTS